MAKYEYRVVQVTGDHGQGLAVELETALNASGREGFNLVHIDMDHASERIQYRCILKRGGGRSAGAPSSRSASPPTGIIVLPAERDEESDEEYAKKEPVILGLPRKKT